jgi:hypothetical protein
MFVADQLSRNFVSNTAEDEEHIDGYIHNTGIQNKNYFLVPKV